MCSDFANSSALVTGSSHVKSLADVGGGLAVDRHAALEQRHVVRRRPPARRAGGSRRARPAPAPRRRRPPARPRAPAPGGSRSRAAGGRTRAGAPGRPRAAAGSATARPPRSAASPVIRASRSRPKAAAEPPEGIGASSRSLRRAIRPVWSSAVEKKPPRSGSWKRSRIVSASSRARGEPALVEGRLVQRQVGLEQVGVVLEEGRELGAAAVERPQQAARRNRAARTR